MDLRQIQRSIRLLPAGRRALSLVWQAARGWTLLWALLLVGQGLLPAALALLLRSLVNRMTHGLIWQAALAPALGMAALWLLGLLLTNALVCVRTVQAEKVQALIDRLLHEQALRLDLSFFDHAESYDILHRARVDASTQPLALLENLGALFQNSLGFLVLAGIVCSYAYWIPLLWLACGIPGLFWIGRQILHEHRWHLQHTGAERHVRYLDWVLTEQSTAAELRVYQLGKHLHEQFERLQTQLRGGRVTMARQTSVAGVGAGALAWAGNLAGLGWILHRTLAGQIGLGDLLFCIQAVQQSQVQLRTLLEGAGKILRSLLFIENLDLFLRQKTRIHAETAHRATLPARRSLRFENIGFTYPGGTHKALDEFSMEIPVGRVVAVVGKNGAGKSTLLKLLCRFYDPDQGRILLDGEDLRHFDPEALREQIGILFQDPVRYQATVRENVGFGAVDALDDEERLRRAVEQAGATSLLRELPGGFDAQLGKWFGGSELSGGQWQRIALARAFFRQAPFVILDEPTSAMDSWAEQDWLQRFRQLTAGKTGLMITHRFTTAMYADSIYVLDRGRVIESGTHNELIASNGCYAYSWHAQTREINRANLHTMADSYVEL